MLGDLKHSAPYPCGWRRDTIAKAGPYGGREKRGKWEELGFFSPNGFAFLTVEGGSGKFQGVS